MVTQKHAFVPNTPRLSTINKVPAVSHAQILSRQR